MINIIKQCYTRWKTYNKVGNTRRERKKYQIHRLTFDVTDNINAELYDLHLKSPGT